MRAFPLTALFAATLLSLAGCSSAPADDKPGYQMSDAPLANPVYDERELKGPPLDPSRKVSEQDCSKPVDLEHGNLRCK